MKIVEKEFQQQKLIGSPYVIGVQQGERIKSDDRLYKYFTKGSFKKQKSGFTSIRDAIDFYESYIPGITEELEGFAEGAGVKIEQLTCIDYPNSVQNNCSHVGLLSQKTESGHVYLFRTYDWHYNDEDMRHLLTNVNSKLAHIGFSTLLVGRTDGINEKGVAVIMAGGGAWDYKLQLKKGLNFSFAIRTILEQASNTQKGIDILTEIPAIPRHII